MDWSHTVFIPQCKTKGKVCKRQHRGLSLYVHGPGLIVGCPSSSSAGIYIEYYIDGTVPLIYLYTHCTECWIEVCVCVCTTLMRTWLTFTAHSCNRSMECRWTGHTQSLYFSTKLGKKCAMLNDT